MTIVCMNQTLTTKVTVIRFSRYRNNNTDVIEQYDYKIVIR